MADEATFKDKRVLVQGLGHFGGGVGVSRWLAEQGARVTVTDTAGAEALAESVRQLADLGERITFKLGGHDVADFTSCDWLITNPAVDKAASEHVQAALRAGVPWTTEMNLFLERCRGFTIGVTGSVGKSTTTALIYEAIRAGLGGGNAECRMQKAESTDGPRVYLGGNIGKSLLAEVEGIRERDVVVLELSSFMLEDTPRVSRGGGVGWSPDIAVVTNLFENHLDRHGTMAGYAGAKQNILRFQRSGDVAVLNDDHELVRRWEDLARGKVVKYTTRGVRKLDLLMPGEHNQSNARAVLAVLGVLGGLEKGPVPFNREAAVRAIEGFEGLAHRLRLVHVEEMAGAGPGVGPRVVRYYNDSKATSAEASITAVHTFATGTAIFIVGGYDKHISLRAFEELLAERAGGVIGIGQTGEAMVGRVRAALEVLEKGPVPFNRVVGERVAYAGTLEAAMELARQWVEADRRLEAVVLSPASASWGQFANYEARGEQFAALARAGR